MMMPVYCSATNGNLIMVHWNNTCHCDIKHHIQLHRPFLVSFLNVYHKPAHHHIVKLSSNQ